MKHKKPVSEVVKARQELTEMGILEDTGERRLDRDGNLAVVWDLSPLGWLVHGYEKRGLTREEALVQARIALGRPH